MTQEKFSRRQVLRGLSALGAATLMGCVPRDGAEDTATVRPSPAILATPTSPGTRWNFIIVMLDTLRHDHVGFYSGENARAQTPNIDAFAAESLAFDRFYTSGFPTLLNRVDLFAGRYAFAYMGWKNLNDDEIVLADVLNQAGYSTAIIFDTWHFKDQNRTYDRGFGYSQWIRGQEGDPYRATPLWPALPAPAEKIRNEGELRQYIRNVSERQGEEDYFVAQTMRAAIDWLRENHDRGPFYLHVDSFDPHEPWDPPQVYVDQYDPGYAGQEIIYPAYAPPDYLTAEELGHVRALYAAEVTMVDHWVGELIREIDALGLRDNTVVFLMSDHGILLGEHNAVGKAWDHYEYIECYPLYEELIRIPLMIRVPGMKHRRIADLAQPPDIMPTMVEWAEAGDPGTIQGISLVPTIEDTDGALHTPPRTLAFASRALDVPQSKKPRPTITDGAWALVHGGERAPGELYHLPDDPQQQANLLDQACDVALGFHEEWVALLERLNVTKNRLDPWRTPPCAQSG